MIVREPERARLRAWNAIAPRRDVVRVIILLIIDVNCERSGRHAPLSYLPNGLITAREIH